MRDDSGDDFGGPARSDLLARIADVLGQPRAAFLDGSQTPTDLAGATELLRHWYDLTSETDRRKVLAFVRGVVAAGRDRLAAE